MKKRLISLSLAAMLFLSACGQSDAKFANTLVPASPEPETETEVAIETETENPELLEDETIATEKDEHADELYAVLASLPAQKPESNLKQADVECDTLQWLTATYAVFCYHTGKELNLIGGYSDESTAWVEELASGLDSSWGIVDRATAIESISWLLVEGHSAGYSEVATIMHELDILEGSDTDIYYLMAEVAESEGWDSEQQSNASNYYTKMKWFYERNGKNGIDAWDYCRAMQLSAQSYLLGYFTLEESLTIQLAIAQVIQEEYASWDDWNHSYTDGYEFWTYGNSSAASRAWSYQKLGYEEFNPFAIIDFDMPLEKFW